MPVKKKLPEAYGPTFKGHFPAEMRVQLWPLCCGAKIISGFKNVVQLSEQELVDQINYIVTKPRPDFQVFMHEQMRPGLTFLTLNNSQMNSAKIMTAIEKAGFFKIGEAAPRGHAQGFFVRDDSDSWKVA